MSLSFLSIFVPLCPFVSLSAPQPESVACLKIPRLMFSSIALMMSSKPSPLAQGISHLRPVGEAALLDV